MPMKPEIARARALLDALTPLATDCGAYCGAACCRADGDAQGMLLLPGEAGLYADCDFAQVQPAAFAGLAAPEMLVCQGWCRREERPLCCRVFPLAPRATLQGFDVRIDRRAFAVCPLAGYGMAAFDRRFVAACREAFNALAQDAECRAYLIAWSRLMDEYARGL